MHSPPVGTLYEALEWRGAPCIRRVKPPLTLPWGRTRPPHSVAARDSRELFVREGGLNTRSSSKIDSSDQHQARVLPGTQVLPASPARRRRRSRDGLLLQQAR